MRADKTCALERCKKAVRNTMEVVRKEEEEKRNMMEVVRGLEKENIEKIEKIEEENEILQI